MSDKLLAVHFRGWLTSENFSNVDTVEAWRASIKKYGENNQILIVFSVPEKISSDLISKIEKLIQSHTSNQTQTPPGSPGNLS